MEQEMQFVIQAQTTEQGSDQPMRPHPRECSERKGRNFQISSDCKGHRIIIFRVLEFAPPLSDTGQILAAAVCKIKMKLLTSSMTELMISAASAWPSLNSTTPCTGFRSGVSAGCTWKLMDT